MCGWELVGNARTRPFQVITQGLISQASRQSCHPTIPCVSLLHGVLPECTRTGITVLVNPGTLLWGAPTFALGSSLAKFHFMKQGTPCQRHKQLYTRSSRFLSVVSPMSRCAVDEPCVASVCAPPRTQVLHRVSSSPSGLNA